MLTVIMDPSFKNHWTAVSSIGSSREQDAQEGKNVTSITPNGSNICFVKESNSTRGIKDESRVLFRESDFTVFLHIFAE